MTTSIRRLRDTDDLAFRIASIIDAEELASNTPKFRPPGTIKARRLAAFKAIWSLIDAYTLPKDDRV
jgi:hypothetical protein